MTTKRNKWVNPCEAGAEFFLHNQHLDRGDDWLPVRDSWSEQLIAWVSLFATHPTDLPSITFSGGATVRVVPKKPNEIWVGRVKNWPEKVSVDTLWYIERLLQSDYAILCKRQNPLRIDLWAHRYGFQNLIDALKETSECQPKD